MYFYLMRKKSNRRNDRSLCRKHKGLLTAIDMKFPATVMVLGDGTNNGDIMRHHFIYKEMWVNPADYNMVLESNVRFFIMCVSKGRSCSYEQNFVLSHKVMTTKEWMRQNFNDLVIHMPV